MKHKLRIFVAWVITIGAGCWLGAEIGDRTVPARVLEHGEISTPYVVPGQNVEVYYNYARTLSCYLLADRQLILPDATRVPLPPLEFHAGILPISNNDRAILSFHLPESTPDGEGQYCTYNIYGCTLLQRLAPRILGIKIPPRCVKFKVYKDGFSASDPQVPLSK